MATEIYGNLATVKVKKDTLSQQRKVYGMAYPILSSLKGYFPKASGKTLVTSQLHQLLQTQKGERVMLPGFGTNLQRYIFEPLTEELFTIITTDIKEAIVNYAPNIRILKLGVFEGGDVNLLGISSILISLQVQVLDFGDEIIDVKVKIG